MMIEKNEFYKKKKNSVIDLMLDLKTQLNTSKPNNLVLKNMIVDWWDNNLTDSEVKDHPVEGKKGKKIDNVLENQFKKSLEDVKNGRIKRVA